MNRKICSVLFLCLVLMGVNVGNVVVRASNSSTVEISELPAIQPYTQILNELSEEYGTEFSFPTNEVIARTGMNRNQVIEEILSVPIANYELFIRNAYNGTDLEGNNQNSVFSMTETQKAYYSSLNYLSIQATTYYADGATRYSSINNYGYGYSNTPYYEPFDMSYTITSDSKNCSVLFQSYYKLNSTVSYDNWRIHTHAAYFRAGGGDIVLE